MAMILSVSNNTVLLSPLPSVSLSYKTLALPRLTTLSTRTLRSHIPNAIIRLGFSSTSSLPVNEACRPSSFISHLAVRDPYTTVRSFFFLFLLTFIIFINVFFWVFIPYKYLRLTSNWWRYCLCTGRDRVLKNRWHCSSVFSCHFPIFVVLFDIPLMISVGLDSSSIWFSYPSMPFFMVQ